MSSGNAAWKVAALVPVSSSDPKQPQASRKQPALCRCASEFWTFIGSPLAYSSHRMGIVVSEDQGTVHSDVWHAGSYAAQDYPSAQ